MSNTLIDQLKNILKKQVNLYQDIKNIGLAKQQSLVSGDLKVLDNLTQQEEVLIIKVGKLEEERHSVHQALANHFLISAEDLTFLKLLEMVEDEEKKEIESLFYELKNLLRDLKKINDTNKSLIEQSLEFVNFSLNLLTGAGDSLNYSGREENTTKGAFPKIFDHKI